MFYKKSQKKSEEIPLRDNIFKPDRSQIFGKLTTLTGSSYLVWVFFEIFLIFFGTSFISLSDRPVVKTNLWEIKI